MRQIASWECFKRRSAFYGRRAGRVLHEERTALPPGTSTHEGAQPLSVSRRRARGRWRALECRLLSARRQVRRPASRPAMRAYVPAVRFLLHFAAHGPGLWRRIVGAGGVTAVLMGIVATHSRGGSLGLAAAVLLWALMSKRKALAMGFALVAGAGLLLFAPSTFWQRNETISAYEADVSVQGRMQAWQVAERIFRERPFLGVGESAFLTAWKQYAPIDDPVEHPYVAHNLELEVLGHLGLFGLFGMMGFIACALWSAWRARNGDMAHESRAVLAALAGYLVCQQFSGYSLSWFLYALCAFASCIDRYGGRRKFFQAQPVGSPAAP